MLIGPLWPLAEIWKDKVLEQRNALDEYMRPFMERGISNRKNAMTVEDEGKGTESSGTLLDHLVSQTTGELFLGIARNCRFELDNLKIKVLSWTRCSI
jgi:hypothetical protein